jgi:K+-dependent Na+/Ca+ exchanger-like protein
MATELKRNRVAKRKVRGQIAAKVATFLGLMLCMAVYSNSGTDKSVSGQVQEGRQLLSGGGGSIDDYHKAVATGDKSGTNYDVGAPVFLHDDAWPLAALIMLYMFIGLAMVCDYFEAALEAISEFLGMSEDVAGATLMAMGSSAPELFTSVMAVFVSENSFGVGTIVGSAVFNVLIIIGLCAVMAPGIVLDWYPLTRDSLFYCLTILALVIIFYDFYVTLEEGIICVVLYVAYVVLMYFNRRMEKSILASVATERSPLPGSDALARFTHCLPFEIFIGVVIIANLAIMVLELSWGYSREETDILNLVFNIIFIVEMALKIYGLGYVNYWRDPINAFDGVLVGLVFCELAMGSDGVSSKMRIIRILRVVRVLRGFRLFARCFGKIKGNAVSPNEKDPTDPEKPPIDQQDDDDDDDDDGPANPFEVPEGALDKAWWVFTMPISLILYVTVPDCRREIFNLAPEAEDDWSNEKKIEFYVEKINNYRSQKNTEELSAPEESSDEKVQELADEYQQHLDGRSCLQKAMQYTFFLTFTMSIVHIAVFSYFMVWMAEILGWKAGIPEVIMGLTFLAAGTSIPDTLASVSVAKKGKGNMAIANSIGSNIFDILIGLGLPWVMKTAMDGQNIQVGSGNEASEATITLSVMILFITVALVVLSIHASSWVLTKKVGFGLLFVYLLYVGQAILVENGIVKV